MGNERWTETSHERPCDPHTCAEAGSDEPDAPEIDWSTRPAGGWDAFRAARDRFLARVAPNTTKGT